MSVCVDMCMIAYSADERDQNGKRFRLSYIAALPCESAGADGCEIGAISRGHAVPGTGSKA